MSKADPNRFWLAVALAVAAIIGFDIMGIMVRLLSQQGYNAAELSAYRNVLGVIPSLILMAWLGELKLSVRAYKIKRWKTALFRGVLVATAQLCFYTALSRLELATISALAQTNSLFVVVLSVLILGERVGIWRISAVLIGFIGVLWVLRPGTDSFSAVALLPVAAAFFYGASIVTVRLFDSSVSSALLYLYSSVAAIIGAFLIVPFMGGFSAIERSIDVLMIVAMSLSGGVAVLLLMLSYRMAEASLLAPFSYFGILTAFGFGYVLFGEAPLDTLFPGVVLIVGAGVIIIWREGNSKPS